ncbi:hypothetical protein EXU85_25765 [Spirosoma sp. KCTC 42546]|uniref:hypothetical protein n=1 Tax=Spirosoma sp. KCTC 42546 TaxID=2520506 RepID=UPI00115AD04F|nr:hypothetical protein [Spirosoma sp. KCTC 42546]QDK81832.1 hypothetical protein EXU85_25765 [Spirosoma sp. KCTC 42546]
MTSIEFTERLEILAKQLKDFADEKSPLSELALKEIASESALVLSQIAILNRIDGYESITQVIPVSKGKAMRELYAEKMKLITLPLLSFLKVTMVRYDANEVRNLLDLAGNSGKIRVCPGLVQDIGIEKYKMSFVLVAEDAEGHFRVGAPLPNETEGTVLDDGKPCPPDCPGTDFITLPSSRDNLQA